MDTKELQTKIRDLETTVAVLKAKITEQEAQQAENESNIKKLGFSPESLPTELKKLSQIIAVKEERINKLLTEFEEGIAKLTSTSD